MGKLALSMQNKSRDSFLSDTKKNLKDCMAITLRSGRELQKRKEDEKIITEKEGKEETGKENEYMTGPDPDTLPGFPGWSRLVEFHCKIPRECTKGSHLKEK